METIDNWNYHRSNSLHCFRHYFRSEHTFTIIYTRRNCIRIHGGGNIKKGAINGALLGLIGGLIVSALLVVMMYFQGYGEYMGSIISTVVLYIGLEILMGVVGGVLGSLIKTESMKN